MTEKPPWKRGDVLAMPNDLRSHRSTGAIAHGCHVFIAEIDPTFDPALGEWCYGAHSARELRLATIADIDRLISIEQSSLLIISTNLTRLLECRAKVVEGSMQS